MKINKFISYILCNNGIIINLHQLYFPSFSFFSTIKQKSFLSSHFFTPPTKHIRGKTRIFSILLLFHHSTIFHPPTFPLLHPNGALDTILCNLVREDRINILGPVNVCPKGTYSTIYF